MPKKTTTTKGKGKGLKKKLGPFPTYVWLLGGVVIVVGYLYLRRKNSSSTAGSENQSIIPSGVITPTQSAATNPNVDTSDSSPNDFPTDYATQTDLQSGLDNLNSEVGAQIAAITFPQPNVNITVPTASVAATTTKSKVAAKKAVTAPAKITYYTYKKNVPLKAGQTLHYTSNKGYYAA
jgi:hypothetical protein